MDAVLSNHNQSSSSSERVLQLQALFKRALKFEGTHSVLNCPKLPLDLLNSKQRAKVDFVDDNLRRKEQFAISVESGAGHGKSFLISFFLSS